jgi:DNA repair ATPase RecN
MDDTNKYSIDPTKFGMTINQAVETLKRSVKEFPNYKLEKQNKGNNMKENIMEENKTNSISDEIKKIQDQVEEIQTELERTVNQVNQKMENITACNLYLTELWGNLNAIKSKEEEVTPVLQLDKFSEFKALKENLLTQIIVCKSFADDLKAGQNVTIISMDRAGDEYSIKRKVKKVLYAPFLITDSGIDEAIILFESEK